MIGGTASKCKMFYSIRSKRVSRKWWARGWRRGLRNKVLMITLDIQFSSKSIQTYYLVKLLEQESWSSGYGRRLMFQRSWVQIPALYTGWKWHFSHLFVVKIVKCVWKDDNKWKRGRGWPIKRWSILEDLVVGTIHQYFVSCKRLHLKEKFRWRKKELRKCKCQ